MYNKQLTVQIENTTMDRVSGHSSAPRTYSLFEPASFLDADPIADYSSRLMFNTDVVFLAKFPFAFFAERNYLDLAQWCFVLCL